MSYNIDIKKCYYIYETMYTKIYPLLFGTIYMYAYSKNIQYIPNNGVYNKSIQTIQSKWIYLRR